MLGPLAAEEVPDLADLSVEHFQREPIDSVIRRADSVMFRCKRRRNEPTTTPDG